ncbi:Alpha/beta hydrolase fold-1 [Roridomyces roridus]|uniref:Alpha/beta hydrolase fold-1 n=1 Tax=Roridomyces roridus TaxID=1738132 RepID=A0AAD7BRX0_9AGAR|nr:Alpha/beta hydrolase fold-1 [Roridomyces roridus]
MAPLASQSYIFDPRPTLPLLISAKRYWTPSSPYLKDPDAYTLILTHGTGFHKEHYEATLEDLYSIMLNNPHGPRIREAWSFDSPNHGDGAVLNEETLEWGYEPTFGWQEFGRGVHAFLCGLGTGVDVDFTTRRLVFIGHSFSAVSLICALTHQPPLKPECLIMLELMCLRAEAIGPLMKLLVDGCSKRRTIWPSREEAYKSLKARKAWAAWDDRVLRAYVDHGFRDLPTREHPNKEGVILKCTRAQETATYRETYSSSLVYRMMGTIVKRFPTHFIYGAIDDYLPREVKEDFLQNGVGGAHNLASLVRIPGAGHIVPQTHPTAFAQAIFDILTKQSQVSQAKL